MESGLFVFPLPILTFLLSAVACVLSRRLDFGNTLSQNLLTSFLGLIAIESLLVALRFGYGIERFLPLQRTLPLFVGPLLYLTFAMLAVSNSHRYPVIFRHLLIAVLAAAAIPMIFGNWINMDWVIGLSYLIYAVALIRLRLKGVNHLTYARLEMAGSLQRWIAWGAAFLLAFLAFDTAITISFMMQRVDNVFILISYASLLLAPVLIAIIVMMSTQTPAQHAKSKPSRNANTEAEKLEQETHAFLLKTQLYVDTDLTVDRLAKRLHVPTRSLSAAINQTKGVNVSQYVNDFRLNHAADLLLNSKLSVAKVMEHSGFLTRSNFYREFQRLYNETPASYRQNHSR
nr:helix-turn-helix transcriptional regulator [Cochlodiniinecator piscidefendens]